MKKTFFFLLTPIFLLACLSVSAQSHEMYLPAPTEATYINEIIMGDTLSDGSRADMDRVYILQRGGVWFFNGIITNIGWDIRIKAENGSGPKPIIYGVVETGQSEVPNYFIRAEGNVFLKNLVINGIFDLDTAYANFTYGAVGSIVIYQVAGDFSMVVDSCVLANAYSSELRISAAIRSIRATNTIFANYGDYPVGDVGNGRAIELRNVSCDSLYIVNNTFVNGFDRVIRHIASTGRLKNVTFEHNTILNVAGTYGVIALGLVGDEIKINNNLFVDPMTTGSDTVAQRQYDFKENGEIFSPDFPDKVKQAWIYSQKADSGYVTNYDISNNYWHETSEIKAVWEEMKSLYRPLLKPAPQMTDFISSQLSDPSSAFVELDDISFMEAPKPMSDYVRWFLSPPPVGSGEYNSGGDFKPQDRRNSIYYRDTMDLSYSTSSPAYSGGTGGFPAGDLNWFPDKKAEWEVFITDVNENYTPNNFSLRQNYPNPFNPSTKIVFNLGKSAFTSLTVYNILGQKISVLLEKELPAGIHEVNFNASNLSTGVYLYKLQAGNNTSVKKMMLIK